MAKTKWIVPAIALVICAASLVGAAYAAYTATLTDSETVNATSNYVELSLGNRTAQASINFEWDTDTPVTAGVAGDTTWTLKENTYTIISFSISKDAANQGSAVNTTYDLDFAISSIKNASNQADYAITGLTFELYNSSAVKQNVLTGLTYGEVYTLKIVSDGSYETTVEPPATLTIAYTITATASMTNP